MEQLDKFTILSVRQNAGSNVDTRHSLRDRLPDGLAQLPLTQAIRCSFLTSHVSHLPETGATCTLTHLLQFPDVFDLPRNGVSDHWLLSTAAPPEKLTAKQHPAVRDSGQAET
jgi:hypothetical protein